ncbi:hypothetical protein D3C84_877370 [compost metagenome]
MNGSDHRFADAIQGFDPAHLFHALAHLQARLRTTTLLDIGARTKAPLAFPANHDHANLGIFLQQRQCLRYALANFIVDGVDLSGAGQYHPAHHGIALQAHRVVDQLGRLPVLRCTHAGHSSNSKTWPLSSCGSILINGRPPTASEDSIHWNRVPRARRSSALAARSLTPIRM